MGEGFNLEKIWKRSGKSRKSGMKLSKPKAETRFAVAAAGIFAAFGTAAETGCAHDHGIEMREETELYKKEVFSPVEQRMMIAGRTRVWEHSYDRFSRKVTAGAAFITVREMDISAQEKLYDVHVFRDSAEARSPEGAVFSAMGNLAQDVEQSDTAGETWKNPGDNEAFKTKMKEQNYLLTSDEGDKIEELDAVKEDERIKIKVLEKGEEKEEKYLLLGKFGGVRVVESLFVTFGNKPDIPMNLAAVWAAQIVERDPTAQGDIFIEEQEDSKTIMVTFKLKGDNLDPKLRGGASFKFREGDSAGADRAFQGMIGRVPKETQRLKVLERLKKEAAKPTPEKSWKEKIYFAINAGIVKRNPELVKAIENKIADLVETFDIQEGIFKVNGLETSHSQIYIGAALTNKTGARFEIKEFIEVGKEIEEDTPDLTKPVRMHGVAKIKQHIEAAFNKINEQMNGEAAEKREEKKTEEEKEVAEIPAESVPPGAEPAKLSKEALMPTEVPPPAPAEEEDTPRLPNIDLTF